MRAEKPTGGSFRLSMNEEVRLARPPFWRRLLALIFRRRVKLTEIVTHTTEPIPYNASAAELQEALEAIPGFKDNATVHQEPSGAFIVTFPGAEGKVYRTGDRLDRRVKKAARREGNRRRKGR